MKIRSIAVAAALMAAFGPANADTITQTLTVSGFQTFVTQSTHPTNSFNEFNTALGTLNSIQVTLTGNSRLGRNGTFFVTALVA
jgi:hypothetical protein